MKMGLLIMVLVSGLVSATAVEKKSDETRSRASLESELREVNNTLAPVRIRARQTPEIIEARKKLDEAYHAFYEALDNKVVELDPHLKSWVERRRALRAKLRELQSVKKEGE